MEPIKFEESNAELGPPPGAWYSENILEVVSLPVWTDGEQIVSCWRPTWRERLSILFFGRVWLSVLSGQQPPVALFGEKEHFSLSAIQGRINKIMDNYQKSKKKAGLV